MGKVPRRRNRPTYPKVKGCHECSKRRVSCDRTEPSCQKCLQQGLVCSGLGIRYRFNHGIASRGKLVGKSPSGEDLPDHTNTVFRVSAADMSDKSPTFETPWLHSSRHLEEELSQEIEPLNLSNLLVNGNINSLPPWKRFLVSYFEQNIAPNMIAVDDESNGYRILILPAAEMYSSVLKAVLASSAYHMALRFAPDRQKEALQCARKFYTEAIDELVQLSPNISTTRNNQTQNTITTFVMLICGMITGSSDFPILFKMLSSSLEAINSGTDLIPFQDFLNTQMRKFKLYAKPFLDSNEALKRLDDPESLSQGLECLLQCSRLHPEHSATLTQASGLIRIAYILYTRRACNKLDRQTSNSLVEQFIVALLNYQPTQVGWNVLVWATFIVAAESSDPTHRSFFMSIFHQYYQRTGFGNLQTAVRMLEEIWENEEESWTESLPGWKAFIM